MHNVVQFPGTRFRPDLEGDVRRAMLLLDNSLIRTASLIANCPASGRRLELDNELVNLRDKLEHLRGLARSTFAVTHR
jgi:hypothetical protein